MGLQNKSCRRPSYLLCVTVIALSTQAVKAVLFDPNCDPSDFDCRHHQDPEQDDVEGEDNIFFRPSFAPTTIAVPPTALPTVLPITTSPTVSPTKTTSSAPSATPSPTVTAAPTVTPSPTRTSAPSLPACKLDDSGFYGDENGNQTPSQPVEMGFNYQVQVTPGTTFVTVQNNVLPSVENEIVANLLPSIFPCSETSDRRRALRLLQSSLTGISAQPSDLILSGGNFIVNEYCQRIP
jgi:hypothetical protein